MKKLLNACLLLAFLLGYIEWGKDHKKFVFQLEAETLYKLPESLQTVFYPFILLPLAGQIMLLYTFFQKKPGRWLSLTGLICLNLLMMFLFLLSLVLMNGKVLASTLPFLITGFFVLEANRKRESTASSI